MKNGYDNVNIIDPEGIASDFLNQWFNDLDYIVAHTSGSTGTPKPVRLLKSDMVQSAKATCEFFSISSESILLCPLSPDYIAGKMMIVRALVSGAKLIVSQVLSFSLSDVASPVALLPIVPAQIDSFLSSPYRYRVDNLLIGGAPLNACQKQKILNAGIKAYASYGMTETCSHVALAKIEEGELIYRSLPGISFSSDDSNCLVINAPQFYFSTITTRDVVRMVGPDSFVWMGRSDNVINSGALKFYPEQIEVLIEPIVKTNESISDFYITKRPSERWGEEIVLIVESSESIDCDELIRNIREALTDKRMTPKDVICLKSFPRTRSGKVRRM